MMAVGQFLYTVKGAAVIEGWPGSSLWKVICVYVSRLFLQLWKSDRGRGWEPPDGAGLATVLVHHSTLGSTA
jgi:hypothetical protein